MVSNKVSNLGKDDFFFIFYTQIQNIIFQFKIIIYEQTSAKGTCGMSVSTSWN